MGFCQRRSPISSLAWVSGSKPASKKVDWGAGEEYFRSRFGWRVVTLPRRRAWSRTVRGWNLGEAALSLPRFCSSLLRAAGTGTQLIKLFCTRDIERFKTKANTSCVRVGLFLCLESVGEGGSAEGE